jgi:hypothetical protein
VTAAPLHGHVAAFGVRFLDDHGGRPVAEGLEVVAWPGADRRQSCPVLLNGTDVYTLPDAPGLLAAGRGEGDDAYWSGAPSRPFTFEVQDRLGRYHPFRFTASLPFRGLFRLACGSPPVPAQLPPGGPRDGVPLFTGPSRPRTPGCVVLRAELWDADAGAPAAWALLQARTPGQALRGEPPRQALADHRGCVALHFPLPDERDFDGGSFDSPSGATGTELGSRTFLVELAAQHGGLPAPPPPGPVPPPVPDLCAALSQPPALLWDRRGPSPLQLTAVTLRLGEERFLRSSDTGGAPAAALLLTRSSSPP